MARRGENAEVDGFFSKAERWSDELAALREVLLGCDVEETLKWRKPCYVHDGDNIAILQPMKEFLALMFFKGTLLDDPKGWLERQGPNSRSARRFCVTDVAQIDGQRDPIQDWVRQAIERRAREVPKEERALAAELLVRLDEDPALKAAFEALTPGRQRHYDIYVSGAKRSSTRAARVEKIAPRILAGKGLRDR